MKIKDWIDIATATGDDLDKVALKYQLVRTVFHNNCGLLMSVESDASFRKRVQHWVRVKE